MLWPLVLPFQITFFAMLAIIVVATLAAPWMRIKRANVFMIMCSIALVGFIPICSGVMSLLDAKRFGVFDHNRFESVRDFRVERYLPPAATQITVDKYAQGFRAKFQITEVDLETWFEGVWSKYGKQSTFQKESINRSKFLSQEEFDLTFQRLKWVWQADLICYSGPRAENGAGFQLYFSPSTGLAYQIGGYW